MNLEEMKILCTIFIQRMEIDSYCEETKEFEWIKENYSRMKRDCEMFKINPNYEYFGGELRERICNLDDKELKNGIFRILKETKDVAEKIRLFGTK